MSRIGKQPIPVPAGVTVTIEGNKITTKGPKGELSYEFNEGYEKKLELVGVGYRAALKGNSLELSLGYSHPVVVEAPEGITFTVPDQTHITVSGADKQAVGQTAAVIRKWRAPEPYKGKGIRYEGEQVRRKLGKAAKGDK